MMDEHDSDLVDEVQPPLQEATVPPERPAVTFMGNTYDLTSLGALASGLLMLFICLTCNMGFYCLPFFPIALGLIGLLTARQALDFERTRLWSWISIGVGGLVLALMAAAIIVYVALIIILLNSADPTYGAFLRPF